MVDRSVRVVFGGLTVLGILGMCVSIMELPAPANFVFGDSLVDAGNNNYLISLSKANFFPQGIDFGIPTGRFTNGKTIVDIIGEELGMGYTPPYLAPTTSGPVVLRGVNYASGGAGILNRTGEIFGDRINLDAQIDNFANTSNDIISSIGDPAAHNLFKRAIFSVTIGSNDFINNLLIPSFSVSQENLAFPELFVATLISRLRAQLTRLFNLGARKIVVANVGPIGCIPIQRDTHPASGNDCVSSSNQIAQLFNTQLKVLLSDLRTNFHGSTILYADVYHILSDIIQNYTAYGFENASSSCCWLARRFGGLIPCGPTSKVCVDRSKYVLWNPYHPSQAANEIIAKRLLDGDVADVSPINLRHLASSSS